MTNTTASATLPRNEFRAALAPLKKVIERRNTIPILSNVLLRERNGVIELVGTDLDIEMTCRVPSATADAGFAVTLPHHTLQDIEKKATAADMVTIDVPESEMDNASLRFAGLRVTMQKLPATDFPEMAIEGKITADFSMSSADLLAMIEAVEFAISTEETRYYLNGIFMHALDVDGVTTLRFVATDDQRLGRTDLPAPDGCDVTMPGVIIPRKTVGLLRDLCKAKGAPDTIAIKVSTLQASFTIGNITMLTKLIDGTFPDYARAIPAYNDKRAVFVRADLIQTIKAVSAMSSERGRAVKVSFGQDAATLSVKNPDTGDASMRVSCEADTALADFEIGFNAAYMLDVLATMDCDTVQFRFSDPGSPTIIQSHGGANTLYVLMPVRL